MRYCVFCASSPGARSDYRDAASELGRELARRGIELVYGGGNVGLMGVLADAVLAAGGHVIGVIPDALVAKEVAHMGLPDLRVVSSMHERKAVMAELSDGFIAMPGGLGTLEEFLEVLTWAQLGVHEKPCALLDTCSYFEPFLAMLDRAVSERFLKPDHRDMLVVAKTPSQVLDLLARHRVVQVDKWIDRSKT